MRTYFNKNLTGTAAQIRALQFSGHEIVVSHTDEGNAMLDAARRCGMTHFTEPRFLPQEAYLEYLDVVLREHQIEAFIPGKFVEAIIGQLRRFPQAIAPGTPEILQQLNDKVAFMQTWPGEILPLAPWVHFRTLAEFDAGREALRHSGVRLCMKPAQGIYASGFRMLNDTPKIDTFLSGELYEMSTQAARELIAAAGDTWPDYLLMHTLEGAERSIDCAALDGRLLGAVVRRKEEHEQHIELRPDLVQAAQEIAEHYRLSGIFNFQTRDDSQGRAHILEINTRASGGIRISLASGVNLPALLLDALSGVQRPQVVTPTAGTRIKEDKVARRA